MSNTRSRFRSDVKFNQHGNVIVFPSRYLDYPIVQNEKTLHAFLKAAPYQLLVMVGSEDSSLREQVVALIGRDFSLAPPSAEQVAKTLNMSVSTLRRRLLEEDTTYQKIKDDHFAQMLDIEIDFIKDKPNLSKIKENWKSLKPI